MGQIFKELRSDMQKNITFLQVQDRSVEVAESIFKQLCVHLGGKKVRPAASAMVWLTTNFWFACSCMPQGFWKMALCIIQLYCSLQLWEWHLLPSLCTTLGRGALFVGHSLYHVGTSGWSQVNIKDSFYHILVVCYKSGADPASLSVYPAGMWLFPQLMKGTLFLGLNTRFTLPY